MNTPNFPQVAADIREIDAEALRIRQNLDNEAERCRSFCRGLPVLAADLIKQIEYVGAEESLLLLHTILRKVESEHYGRDHLIRELDMICRGLADDIAGVER